MSSIVSFVVEKEKYLLLLLPKELVNIVMEYVIPYQDIFVALAFDLVHIYNPAPVNVEKRIAACNELLLKMNSLVSNDLIYSLNNFSGGVSDTIDKGQHSPVSLFLNSLERDWGTLWNDVFHGDGDGELHTKGMWGSSLDVCEEHDFPLEKYFHLFSHPGPSLRFYWHNFFDATGNSLIKEMDEIEECCLMEKKIIEMFQANPEKYQHQMFSNKFIK